MRDIPVTETKSGMTSRQIAVVVIAEKLGIPESDVKKDTDLGDAYGDIVQVLCLKIGKALVGEQGMTAGELFDQL